MRARRGRHQGFSLVEMMVALVIGLVVVGAVLMNYLGTGTSGTQRASISQMSEDAQVALLHIARDLQMAGYTEVLGVMTSGPGGTASFVRPGGGFRPVFACNGAFADPLALMWAATCSPAASQGQSLEVNYQATPANTMVNSLGMPTDCLGNSLNVARGRREESVPGAGTATVIFNFTSNRYFINRSTGRPELHCASAAAGGPGASGPQPLIDNAEDLRFWFGVVPLWNPAEPAQRQPARYLPPDAMTADDWHRVVSVRICLLMRTAEPVMSPEEAVAFRYTDCAGTQDLGTPDRRIYRAFHTTVSLRNRGGF